jgi:hypothetical protein
MLIFKGRAPVAQLDRASGYEVDANSIQVVATVALTSSEPSLACSKVAPKIMAKTWLGRGFFGSLLLRLLANDLLRGGREEPRDPQPRADLVG